MVPHPRIPSLSGIDRANTRPWCARHCTWHRWLQLHVGMKAEERPHVADSRSAFKLPDRCIRDILTSSVSSCVRLPLNVSLLSLYAPPSFHLSFTFPPPLSAPSTQSLRRERCKYATVSRPECTSSLSTHFAPAAARCFPDNAGILYCFDKWHRWVSCATIVAADLSISNDPLCPDTSCPSLAVRTSMTRFLSLRNAPLHLRGESV